jgi:hypothetical protein
MVSGISTFDPRTVNAFWAYSISRIAPPASMIACSNASRAAGALRIYIVLQYRGTYIAAQYLIGAFVDRVIADDFELFDVKANLLQSILRGYSKRHGQR